MDAADTADIYEIIVERHRAAATAVTSNREPAEWLALMADPLLPVRHRPAPVRRLGTSPRRRVLPAPPKARHPARPPRRRRPRTPGGPMMLANGRTGLTITSRSGNHQLRPR